MVTGTTTGDRTAAREPLPAGRRWQPALGYWWTRYTYTWRGSVISQFLMPVLFLGSMGVVVGGMVDERTGGIDGVPYVQFVAPGILVAQAMFSAMFESTYPVLGAIKWDRQYHAMLATPLGVRDVLLGHLAYLTLQVTFGSVVFALVGTVFGAWASWSVVLAVPLAILTGMAFSVPCVAFAAAVKENTELGFTLLFRFVMTPLFLFSGTFFPLEQLPVVLRPVAWVTPLWHGVDASRSLALGSPDWPAIAGHTTYLVVVVAVAFGLASRAFRRRLVE